MLSSKEKKRLYDIEYRRKNKETIRNKNIIYNESEAGRAMQKRARDKQKESHLEYCRTDKYRKLKCAYDEKNLAKRKYGEYWECMILIKKIDIILRDIFPTSYERRKARGYYR